MNDSEQILAGLGHIMPIKLGQAKISKRGVGLVIVGVTSFPCLFYNFGDSREPVRGRAIAARWLRLLRHESFQRPRRRIGR